MCAGSPPGWRSFHRITYVLAYAFIFLYNGLLTPIYLYFTPLQCTCDGHRRLLVVGRLCVLQLLGGISLPGCFVSTGWRTDRKLQHRLLMLVTMTAGEQLQAEQQSQGLEAPESHHGAARGTKSKHVSPW